MIQFHSKNLWRRIETVSKNATAKRAAIAYVTKDLPLALQSEDTLVADCSDAAIASGETSAKVLAELHGRGVHLFSYGALHAKVVVLDGIVFVSSANLSESSQSTLLEAGLETDNPTAVAQAIGFIESLAEQSESIDAKFIARIATIPVNCNGRAKSTGKHPQTLMLPDTPKIWLIGVHLIEEPKDPDEVERVEKGVLTAKNLIRSAKNEVSWIRFGKTYRVSKHANRGDSLVIIWREKGNGPPETVYRHCPVLLNQLEPKCNRIYYERLPDYKERALRWQEFEVLAKKVGLAPTSKDTMRELTLAQSSALHELWEEARKQ